MVYTKFSNSLNPSSCWDTEKVPYCLTDKTYICSLMLNDFDLEHILFFLQVERDIMIWNHKTYVPKPLLVKEDHLIKKHRRWYSQFYSENSPRLSMKKENLDW